MNLEFFIAGCVGALAPEVIRLYETQRLRTAGISFSAFYWAISAIYAALAGYVASIFPGLTGPFYAFCVGVGFQLIVNKASTIAVRLVSSMSGTPPAAPVDRPDSQSTDGFPRRKHVPNAERRSGNVYEFLSLV